MVISGDAFLRKIHDRAVAALLIVGFLKVIASLAHGLPHTCGLNSRIAVVDIIAKVHSNRNVLFRKHLEVCGVCRRSSARLNGCNGRDMVGILCRCPERSAALGMCYQNGILSGPLRDLIDRRGHRLSNQIVVEVCAHIGGHARIRRHLTEKLIDGFWIVGELGAFIDYGFSIFPAANAELCIPSLIQRRCADGSADGSRSGFSSVGLVNQKYAVARLLQIDVKNPPD